MKHFISFNLLVFLCSFNLLAQKEVQQKSANKDFRKINVGINFGLNSSTIIAENKDTVFSDDFSRRTSGHFGFKVMYNLNPYFSLRSGFTLNTRGYTIKEKLNIGNASIDSKYTFGTVYMDIPLMLQVNLAPKANGGLFLKTGAYYGFAIGGRAITSSKSNNSSQSLPSSSENLKIGNSKDDDLKKVDHGLIIGGGLKFKRFEVGLVWDIGLVNIAPDSDDGLSAKNRLFRVDIIILAL